MTTFGLPMAITGLNWFARFVIKNVMPYEGINCFESQTARASRLLSWSLILTTGGVLVYINLEYFGRAYWYLKIGVVITTNMLFTIFINNVLNPMFIFGYGLLRWYDRKF